MKHRDEMRHPVRVLFHLNEGYTCVLMERLVGDKYVALHDLDIPTKVIPPHLRPLGSRFMLVWSPFSVKVTDSIEDIRNHVMNLRAEELPPAI